MLPFLALALSLILAIVIAPEPPDLQWLKTRPGEPAALALTLGALAFINTWDFPVYLGLVGLAVAVRWLALRDQPPQLSLHSPPASDAQPYPGRLAALVKPAGYALLGAGALAAAGALLYFPFYLSFDSQTTGILPYTGPATRPVLFLVAIGLPAMLGAAFVARAALDAGRPNADRRNFAIAAGGFAVGVFALWLIAAAVRASVAPDETVIADWLVLGRLILAVPLLLTGALAAYCALSLTASNRRAQWEVYGLILAAVGFFLLGGAELFHIADQFGNRMNTVFKFYYQAWLLLGIAGAIGLYHVVAVPLRQAWADELPALVTGLRIGWLTLVAILLLASAYYPLGAALERTGWTAPGETRADNTLHGLAFLAHTGNGEYAAIRWLQDTAGPGRILEAVGDDYTGHGGYSATSGRATVLMWEGHERQWRGDDINPELARRRADVATIYTTDAAEEARSRLRQYGVRWLVVGPRESLTYGDEVGARMVKWADAGWLIPAFESGSVAIYEVVGSGGAN